MNVASDKSSFLGYPDPTIKRKQHKTKMGQRPRTATRCHDNAHRATATTATWQNRKDNHSTESDYPFLFGQKTRNTEGQGQVTQMDNDK